MTSVIGSEVVSALLRSSSNDLFQRLLGGGVAELVDLQLGVAMLGGGDRGEAGVDPRFGRLLVAGDAEFDQRRVTVGGDRLRHRPPAS